MRADRPSVFDNNTFVRHCQPACQKKYAGGQARTIASGNGALVLGLTAGIESRQPATMGPHRPAGIQLRGSRRRRRWGPQARQSALRLPRPRRGGGREGVGANPKATRRAKGETQRLDRQPPPHGGRRIQKNPGAGPLRPRQRIFPPPCGEEPGRKRGAPPPTQRLRT